MKILTVIFCIIAVSFAIRIISFTIKAAKIIGRAVIKAACFIASPFIGVAVAMGGFFHILWYGDDSLRKHQNRRKEPRADPYYEEYRSLRPRVKVTEISSYDPCIIKAG